MTKAEIRKRILALRRDIPNREVYNNSILCKLTELEIYKKANVIMTYISYNGEVDTLAVIDRILADGKTLCAPKCIDNHTMEARKFSCRSELKKGAYGISEPAGEIITDIDLVIVPGVAFNEGCHRIGYGGGYYDRFLKNNTATAVGLFYELQRANFTEEEKDISLDYIITEKNIYERGNKL